MSNDYAKQFHARLAEVDSISTIIAEVREGLKTFSMEIFTAKMKDFFEKYPTLETVSWTVYTPWCDGDVTPVCSYHEECLINAECGDEDDEEHDYNDHEESDESLTPELLLAAKEIREFMKQFADEDMENMFGDEIKVIVSRDGIETESYDGDY